MSSYQKCRYIEIFTFLNGFCAYSFDSKDQQHYLGFLPNVFLTL